MYMNGDLGNAGLGTNLMSGVDTSVFKEQVANSFFDTTNLKGDSSAIYSKYHVTFRQRNGCRT